MITGNSCANEGTTAHLIILGSWTAEEDFILIAFDVVLYIHSQLRGFSNGLVDALPSPDES